MYNLSILIPTLVDRSIFFNRIVNQLENQIIDNNLENKIEVVAFLDNFENSIGYKRNKLLEKSTGKFTCFVDDDDILSDEYCKTISDIIDNNENIQHIGFKVKLFINGKERQPVYHSLKYKGWYRDKGAYYRETTTLNPILSSISKQFKFSEINMGEDKKWVDLLIESKLLKEEYFIDEFMYHYYYNKSTSLSGDRQNINKNNQKINWEIRENNKLKIINI